MANKNISPAGMTPEERLLRKIFGEEFPDEPILEAISRETLIYRGKCCGLLCKNCPYETRHTRGSMKLSKSP